MNPEQAIQIIRDNLAQIRTTLNDHAMFQQAVQTVENEMTTLRNTVSGLQQQIAQNGKPDGEHHD